MIKIPLLKPCQAVLFICAFVGALLLHPTSGNAWTIKIDPVWAAKRAAGELPVLHADTAGNRQEGVIPVPRSKPLLVRGVSKQVRGIRITPASASWKLNGLKPRLVRLLARVQLHFGRPLHIVSGCRSKKHNRRVGGARRSQHLHCKAADFQIPGVSKYKLAAYLKRMKGRGGVGVYCRSSYVHLDIGPKRQWHWSCGKRKKYKKHRKRRSYARLSNSSKKRHGLRKKSSRRTGQKTVTIKINK